MTTLLDRNGKLCAYIYNNKILLADTMAVAGVMLGDCVFGLSGEVKGKIFDRILYAASGEIVANEIEIKSTPEFDAIAVLFQGWNILEKITDHECPWITPKKKWTALSIAEFLTQQGVVKVILHNSSKALY